MSYAEQETLGTSMVPSYPWILSTRLDERPPAGREAVLDQLPAPIVLPPSVKLAEKSAQALAAEIRRK